MIVVVHKAHQVVSNVVTAWAPDEHQKYEQARQIVNALILAGFIDGEVVNGCPTAKAE
jgi:hypothetical protein